MVSFKDEGGLDDGDAVLNASLADMSTEQRTKAEDCLDQLVYAGQVKPRAQHPHTLYLSLSVESASKKVVSVVRTCSNTAPRASHMVLMISCKDN